MGTIKRKKKMKHTDLIVQQKDHLAIEVEESLREWKPYLWKFFVVSLFDHCSHLYITYTVHMYTMCICVCMYS